MRQFLRVDLCGAQSRRVKWVRVTSGCFRPGTCQVVLVGVEVAELWTLDPQTQCPANFSPSNMPFWNTYDAFGNQG